MNSRAITIGFAVLVLAGLAYYVGSNREPAVVPDETKEVAVATDPKATETLTSLVGVWKSKDDSKFTREFTAEGTIIDRYEGGDSATSNGTFTVFTSTMEIPDGVTFELEADDAYIRAIMDGEGYNFLVSSVTASDLELIYMDRGGVLRFSKVQ